ncbi:PREDICTED: phospholipase A1-like [Vollenhovia emeryi]|uniref:phospholipase A1-like n=1 Tax=Vollenhovia emeryi TaxID=411798 RepID=UPI0005F581BD|nr:PREDICTED: phospholipase A1-like [Vollenhovia emeryi]
MRTAVTILAILFVQYAHSRAAPKPLPEPLPESWPESWPEAWPVAWPEPVAEPFFRSDDNCAFGVKVVSLLLFNSRITGQNMSINDMCTNVDSSKKVVFLTHGFLSSADTENFVELARQLRDKGYTVLGVDWRQGACTGGLPTYDNAVTNTVEVGRRVAGFAEKLVNECHVPLNNIIFIGHSLGAHVSGFAAKEIKKKNLGTVSLIIAADPAGPTLGSKECNDRLCKTDANCVKVLHTSSMFGMTQPVGHLDLQFNGGSSQPDCILPTCSHSAAVVYITDVVKGNCAFPGVPMTNSPKYPSNTDTNCILVNENLLDTSCSIKGEYYTFVNGDSHCTQNPPQKCQK